MTTDPNPETFETPETESITNMDSTLETRLQVVEMQFQEWSTVFTNFVSQLEKDTKLVSQLTQQTERRSFEVSQTQQEITKVYEAIAASVIQLGGIDGLETLRQEHKNILGTLQNLQLGNQRLHELQIETTQAEARLSQTQKRVDEVSQLITTAQAELVKQAMSLTEDLQQRYATLVSSSSPSSSASSEVSNQDRDSQIAAYRQIQAEASQTIQTLQQLMSQSQAPIAMSLKNSSILDSSENLRFSSEEPVIEYTPEEDTLIDANTGPKPTLEQVRAELYGIAQQTKMDKEAFQREQKQKLKSLEQKQKSLRTWLIALTVGVVLALGSGVAALLMKVVLKS